MIDKIKLKFKNNDTKVLVSNFSYLTVIELSNYILPFIAIPYIVRVIGVEKFGLIMFAYAIMLYFNLLTNYGFKMIGAKYVSLNRNDTKKINKYFSIILFSQVLLLIISFFVFILLLFNIESLYEEKLVFIYAFGMVIGNVIFPVWLFQGFERMKYISIFNVFSKLLYTVSIFIFVNSSNDYILIPLINSLSLILVGVVSLYYTYREFNIRFVGISISEIKLLFIEGWYLFLSALASNIYTATNTILLGVLTNYTVVGVFSIAATISNAVTKIIKIYPTVTFPYLAKYANNKTALLDKSRKLLLLYLLILSTLSISLFFSSELLILFVFGANNEASVLILKILAVSILVEPLGAYFTSYLVIKNESKYILKITFFTMLVNFIFVIPLVFLFQAVGMAVTKLIVESFQVYLNIIYNKELIPGLKKKQ